MHDSSKIVRMKAAKLQKQAQIALTHGNINAANLSSSRSLAITAIRIMFFIYHRLNSPAIPDVNKNT
jgi:hypothetical protein